MGRLPRRCLPSSSRASDAPLPSGSTPLGWPLAAWSGSGSAACLPSATAGAPRSSPSVSPAFSSHCSRPGCASRAGVKSWYARGRVGAHEALRLGAPLIWLTLAGAALSGVLDLFDGLPRGLDTAVFSACVSIGIVWTVFRLVPVAVRGTTEATEVAATAFGDFLQAAGTVLRTPTLIWMFVGGALVTFAVNGLIAWAPSFLELTHGRPVAAVGRQFGVWGLAGGALGALFG